MPRDGAGLYSLPSGNPVVTNTVIASAWANTTMSDIAAQLNNVLTRDGLLGPVGPFKIVDGTVAAPGLAFNSEPGLGFYRSGASSVLWAAQGATVWGWGASGSTMSAGFWPRTAGGASALRLNNQPNGAANVNILGLFQNADGSALIQTATGGSATRGNLNLDAPVTSTTGSFNVAGNAEAQNGFLRILQKVNAGGAYATLQFATPNANRVMRFTNGAIIEWVNSANSAVIMDFDDAGNARKLSGGTTWGTVSDVRAKTDIEDWDGGLDEVLSLRPRKFTRIDTGERSIGCVADEAEVGFGELIERKPGKIGEVEYPDRAELHIDPLFWALVNATKELHARLSHLELQAQ